MSTRRRICADRDRADHAIHCNTESRPTVDNREFMDFTDDRQAAARISQQTLARLPITKTRRALRAAAITHRASSP
ncbi:hypothetical protein EMIT0111MI5_30344 [Burkholderia sp. IT-111MI5]